MRDETISAWLAALAAKEPVPGGGAAASLLAATSAALIGMAAAFTTGEKWADRENEMKSIQGQAEALRIQALELADADSAAFAGVGAAYKLPKTTEAEQTERMQAIEAALIRAAGPPRETAVLAAELIVLSEKLADKTNPNVLSDVGVASSAARAALESAILNISINKQLIKDTATKNTLAQAMEDGTAYIARADAVTLKVRRLIGQSS